ncbi:hypothetical protein EMIHUDRAFT_206534 [Emiliania huxleyi CCMP1516]|uniref:SNF2 N-terminal domain-containing protein n=2 Tax=Emiliania huxleyi TaxID=2903 RepID=A0A0D3JM10_EMIH1|nr:hypothetical protein EMIHUDRAFT_206534 [Emiliania huxleyi CCMP1516]EOD24545.1 hypothetical protein EMIHUDRAFT_206534 [Emiliania huxleyi CCMP1516]|eukprot:XP_005776974.1 hypothetical protein EMIHUDRAFT_206534 [Emiliania huxleyi CCMP1516]
MQTPEHLEDGDVVITEVITAAERQRLAAQNAIVAEAAFELSVFPDAAGFPAGCTVVVPTAAGGAVTLEEELPLTAEEIDEGKAETLPAQGRLVDRDTFASRYVPRLPRLRLAAGALARMPASLILRVEMRPVIESSGRRSDAVLLRVEATLSRSILASGDMRVGRQGAEGVVAACLEARKHAGLPTAAALAKASRGIHLPPRAERNGRASLRSLRGMLDALETEGTAAPVASPPIGLPDGLALSEYQSESLSIMLARERSAYGLEDLLQTQLGSGVVVTQLPGGGVTFSDSPPLRHRGGILAEEMGMGKTVLVGQWKLEVALKAPGLGCIEWAAFRASGGGRPTASESGGRREIARVVLAAYSEAGEVAGLQHEWWRVVCDEPHQVLTARPRAGRIDAAAEVGSCARIQAGRRWCLTGTPFTNSFFDVFGQLVFLGLIGHDDTGRAGTVGVLPALHFRNELDGGGRYQAMVNDSAEAIVSLLKPLLVRHTQGQRRNGTALLSLKPLSHALVLVAPTEAERELYAAARDEGAAVDARLHAHAHSLRPMLEVCAGLHGATGAKAAKAREAGLALSSASNLAKVARRVVPLLPGRDDFTASAKIVPEELLSEWQSSFNVEGLSAELSCAVCFGRISRPAAPSSCGHLMCLGCAEELVAAGDLTPRMGQGVRISGHSAFPPGCTSRDIHAARAAKARAKETLIDTVHAALQGHVPRADIRVEVHAFMQGEARAEGEAAATGTGALGQCWAYLHLASFELETSAAKELDDKHVFAEQGARAKVTAGRYYQQHRTCPCPVRGCGRRFAVDELLDVRADVVEHAPGQRWRPIVREFVAAAAVRERKARRVASKAAAARVALERSSAALAQAAAVGEAPVAEAPAAALAGGAAGGSLTTAVADESAETPGESSSGAASKLGAVAAVVADGLPPLL